MFIFAYANNLESVTAEKLAMEGLEILLESRIIANFVATDFQEDVAIQGDVVKADYPLEMEAQRTPENTDIVVGSATAAHHLVKLDQHITVGRQFTDREKQRSFRDLITYFFAPMVRAVAEKGDRIIQGEKYGSYLYTAGKLGTNLDFDASVDAGTLMTENHVPMENRNLILGPRLGAGIRKASGFVPDVSLTDSSLIRTGVIGSVNGFLVSETASFNVVPDSTFVSGLVNQVGGYGIGDTAISVDGFSSAITAGSWVKVDGVPYRIAGTTGGATPTVITLADPLRSTLADNSDMVVFTPSLVNFASGYSTGYEGGIEFDGVTPQLGQGVTFGTAGLPYSVISVSGTTVTLNRPLDSGVSDNDEIFLMPGGNYGIGITPSSIQLVNRPLALPGPNQGVDAFVAVGENWSLRVMRGFQQLSTKETITVDYIMGVANLFPNYNVLYLG